MNQATDNGSRRTIGRVLEHAAAALLFTAAIIQPKVANAAHGGGGFHRGGGGFHGGGFHHRFRHFRGGFGFGGIYAPFWWGYGYYNWVLDAVRGHPSHHPIKVRAARSVPEFA